MGLCGQWKEIGASFCGHRYGKCPVAWNTHCPHSFGDDDEWCCCCVKPVTHERDLAAYEQAYGKFEEDANPAVLCDDPDGLFVSPAVSDPFNIRTKSRAVFLEGSDELLAAWLSEMAARLNQVGQWECEVVGQSTPGVRPLDSTRYDLTRLDPSRGRVDS